VNVDDLNVLRAEIDPLKRSGMVANDVATAEESERPRQEVVEIRGHDQVGDSAF
jgi:hypothetical protein